MTPIVYELRQVPERLRAADPARARCRRSSWPTSRSSSTGSGRSRTCGSIASALRGRRVRRRRAAVPVVRRPVHGAALMAVIDAQAVSKRFLLRHNASVELKVRFLGLLHPEQARDGRGVLGAQGRLAPHRSRRGGRPGRTQRIRQEHVSEARRRHPPADERPPARRARRADRLDDRARRRISSGTDRPRERLSQRLDPRPDARGDREDLHAQSSSTPDSSTSWTCRSRTTRRACTCGWASRLPRISIPTSCCSTRSSRSATPTSSSDASPRSSSSWRTARPSSSCRTHPRRFAPICRRVCVLEQGELVFDGDVETGLAFYEQSLAQRVAPPGEAVMSPMYPPREAD